MKNKRGGANRPCSTPLLSRTGSPNDVSVHDFPDRFADREVYAEFLGPGDTELALEFDGTEYDPRFYAVARQKIAAWDIEFVHAEGENEGQPMAHLPVFTPSKSVSGSLSASKSIVAPTQWLATASVKVAAIPIPMAIAIAPQRTLKRMIFAHPRHEPIAIMVFGVLGLTCSLF